MCRSSRPGNAGGELAAQHPRPTFWHPQDRASSFDMHQAYDDLTPFACRGINYRQALSSSVSSPRVSPTRPGTARTASSVPVDRKSTRLNSSHVEISYAVFCLKKKKKPKKTICLAKKKEKNKTK